MVLVLAFAAFLVLSCTEPQFTNPHDPDSDNYLVTQSSSSSVILTSSNSLVYEGQTYRTVVIGTQIWMAENLNYDKGNSKCYDNKPENCEIYGRLYDWETANEVCPDGWHLPSSEDWSTLANYITEDKSCDYCDATYLKSTSGWNAGRNGEDVYGFTALPGGYCADDGIFGLLKGEGIWWSSTMIGTDTSAKIMKGEIVITNNKPKTNLYSVRCVMDSN